MEPCLLCKLSADDLSWLSNLGECGNEVSWDLIPYDFRVAPSPSLDEEASVSRLTSDVSRWGDL